MKIGNLQNSLNQEGGKDMEAAKLDFDILKSMTKALNTATYTKDGEQVPFLAKKVKTIAVTKEGLAKAFDEAVQGIDADVVNDLPEEIIDYYNENFVEEAGEGAEAAGEGAEASPEEAKPPKAEKSPNPKKEKAEKPAKEKKPKKDIPLSCFGHQVGSQAAALDDLIAPGKAISLDDLSKKSGRSPLGVKSHIKHLQDARGLTINEKDGMYQLIKK
jgi:biotin operon repressor